LGFWWTGGNATAKPQRALRAASLRSAATKEEALRVKVVV
jgi:hypothetical protein